MPKRKKERSRKPTSKTALGRRLSRKLKEHHARVRQIQKKEPWLDYASARRRDKESFIETIRHSGRRADQVWIEVPSKRKYIEWKKVLPGKPAEVRYTYGRRYRGHEVNRSRAQFTYWALVERTAKMWGLSIQDARRLITRMKEEMTRLARQHGVKKKYRSRDAVAVLEYSDRYQSVRMEFGI